jgi:dephospho-CoA kinase
MKVVAISGGIGSGKTTVCRLLETTYGWPVYEADGRVKHLYAEYPHMLEEIERELAENFRNDDGNFVPSKLAARIFSNPDALKVVEDIVFPVLHKDFESWKKMQEGKEYVVLESATILEKQGLHDLYDHMVIVDAPLSVRIERAMKRDGTTYDSVMRRVMNQQLMNAISSGDIPSGVDFVISNAGEEDDLEKSVAECVDFVEKQKCF